MATLASDGDPDGAEDLAVRKTAAKNRREHMQKRFTFAMAAPMMVAMNMSVSLEAMRQLGTMSQSQTFQLNKPAKARPCDSVVTEMINSIVANDDVEVARDILTAHLAGASKGESPARMLLDVGLSAVALIVVSLDNPASISMSTLDTGAEWADRLPPEWT